MTTSLYAAKPWLGRLNDAQRAPVAPADSAVHALRRVFSETPDRTFLAYDDQGQEVPFGEQGEILVRGPQVVPGCWGRPEATAETPDGELRTGDIGFMDPGGYRGETVEAYINLRPGCDTDPDALASYYKERLAAFKYPRQVEVLPDLPKTASGKILRRELRYRSQDSQ